MSDYRECSIKIKNYKCFGQVPEGFDCIYPINVIIGKNNSGKSTLLDLLQLAVAGNSPSERHLWHDGQQPELMVTGPISNQALTVAFKANTSGGGVPGGAWSEYGRKFSKARVTYVYAVANRRSFHSMQPSMSEIHGKPAEQTIIDGILGADPQLFGGFIVHRLHAERNIIPETESDNLGIDGQGLGATSLIQNYLHRAKYPKRIISREFLHDLNSIVEPSYSYREIDCRRQDNGLWEVFLDEEHKGHVALSQTGSGIKTIILALLFLTVLPKVANKDSSKLIFAFEELENNLHPAILRRLLKFIEDYALRNKATIFFTTHSSIAIDIFSHSKDAQILHVIHDNKLSSVKRTSTVIDNRGVLDDLDIRSSDVLQSNGLIWVEGPSDRLYLNKWISLFSEGSLQEGTHYQCLFYGGRLLSYLSAEGEPTELSDRAVKILTVNRNAALLIDSDKENSEDGINTTKQRIVHEIENVSGVAWVTNGREIENYIPVSVLNKYYGRDDIRPVPQFQKFEEYLDEIKMGEGKHFLNKKPLFAERVLPLFTRDDLIADSALNEKLAQLCAAIKSWNGL